jgi:tRNA A37 threonylcarbamoyltransferase TsaD
MTPAEVASELVALLGAKMTAAAGGVSATRLVREWMSGTRHPNRVASLATALKAARAIGDRDGEIVAQRWFVGTNHLLGHVSPLEVLAENTPEGRTRVMRAAVAFVT